MLLVRLQNLTSSTGFVEHEVEVIMHNSNGRYTGKILAVAAALLCVPLIFAAQSLQTKKAQAGAQKSEPSAQTLEAKLSQKATFVPRNRPALDQLIEVAQHYRIPMGIEWNEQAEGRGNTLAVGRDANVRELINAILAQAPDEQMTVENGIVHVGTPALATDAKNILNLRIEDFQVKNENLFYAEDRLRLAIDMTLHPEDYEEGYNGGYGYAPDDVFAVRNISFRASNVTVRDILDRIALANGHALWVARLSRAEQEADGRKSQKAVRSEPPPAKQYPWKFIPLGAGEPVSNR
jgi:hypothetical protein